jgi:hypothetical protein
VPRAPVDRLLLLSTVRLTAEQDAAGQKGRLGRLPMPKRQSGRRKRLMDVNALLL